MGDDPRSAIARLLDELQPRTLLLLTPDPHTEWRRWCEQHSEAAVNVIAEQPLDRLEQVGRRDLALVIGLIERLDKEEGTQLIGRLRNVHTEHLFVLSEDDARWPPSEWYALALQRADQFQVGGRHLTLYGYDLASYNRARSWNNAKYWANPQNWGKYWW